MKKTPHKAIYALLKGLIPLDADPDNGKVYLMRAPDGDAGPFIIFQQTDSQRWRSINGPSGMSQVFMQVDTYAASSYATQELSAEVESILDGYRGTVYYGDDSPQDFVRIAGITLQNDVDIFDQTDQPLLFRKSASYLITFEQ